MERHEPYLLEHYTQQQLQPPDISGRIKEFDREVPHIHRIQQEEVVGDEEMMNKVQQLVEGIDVDLDQPL